MYSPSVSCNGSRFTNSQPSLRRAHRTDRKAGNMRLAHTERKINSEQAAYYVFNQENNAGYVIVSGDDLAPDVLVYGEQGQFDIATINPNFRFWLRYLQEQMSVINEENAAPKKQPMVTPIAPLLVNKEGKEIAWYQEKPYNNLCPIDKLDNTRSLTGCVATAAAQLMYKWRYPQTGMDKFSYVWENCLDEDCYYTDTTTLSLDFSQITFDWDNMLPAYEDVSSTTAQKNAVATLMYACGVSHGLTIWGMRLRSILATTWINLFPPIPGVLILVLKENQLPIYRQNGPFPIQHSPDILILNLRKAVLY